MILLNKRHFRSFSHLLINTKYSIDSKAVLISVRSYILKSFTIIMLQLEAITIYLVVSLYVYVCLSVRLYCACRSSWKNDCKKFILL